MRKKLNIDFDKIQNSEEVIRKCQATQGDNVNFMKELGLLSDHDSQDQEWEYDQVYKYYPTISRLLYVYGDKPNPDSQVVRIVHSQLQELVSKIFTTEIINELLVKCKLNLASHDYKSDIYQFVPQEETYDFAQNKFPTNLKQRFRKILQKVTFRKIKFILSIYFLFFLSLLKALLISQKIFKMLNPNVKGMRIFYFMKRQVIFFFDQSVLERRAKQNKLQAKKDKKIKLQEEEIESSLSEQQSLFQEENEYSNSSYSQFASQSSLPWISNSQQESQQSEVEHSQNPQIKSIQLTRWDRHMTDRLERMDLVEFQSFMNARSQTFLQQKGVSFLQFIDQNNLGEKFRDECKTIQRFLNYALCRVTREIAVNSFMSSSEPFISLEVDTTRKIGYKIIEKYCVKSKKYALTRKKAQDKAYKLFSQEYFSEGYEALLSIKQHIKIIKDKGNLQVAAGENKDPEQIEKGWKSMKLSRNMWVDRVIAEKHFFEVVKQKKKLKNHNEYFVFIYDKFKKSQCDYLQFKKLLPKIFKEWFIGIGRSK